MADYRTVLLVRTIADDHVVSISGPRIIVTRLPTRLCITGSFSLHTGSSLNPFAVPTFSVCFLEVVNAERQPIFILAQTQMMSPSFTGSTKPSSPAPLSPYRTGFSLLPQTTLYRGTISPMHIDISFVTLLLWRYQGCAPSSGKLCCCHSRLLGNEISLTHVFEAV